MSAGSEKTYDCDGETALQASEDAIMYLGWALDRERLGGVASPCRDVAEPQVVDGQKSPSKSTSGTTAWVASRPKYELLDWGERQTEQGQFLQTVSEGIHRVQTRV